MEQIKSQTTRAHRVPGKPIAAVAFALGGLSVSVFAVSAASAVTNHSTRFVISTSKSAKYGTVLVSNGRTLYTVKPSSVACSTQCLKIWPAVLLPKGVTKATAAAGVSASKLGTVKRSGGGLQVTYSGKALYRFSLDTAAGQVKGNVTDTWGKWSAFVTVKPSSGSGGGGNTGGGGIAF